MPRLISPPLEAFADLRQPLTPGERLVFEMFNDTLPPGWEIYLQPHLNGLRPDFVLLNPDVGIGVFEVKDWNLGALRYFTKKDQYGLPVLMGEQDGRQFSLQSQNPVTKVDAYKQSIYNLYCPRLAQKNGYGAITAGVIFPFARAESVRSLFSPFIKNSEDDKFAKYSPISGMEEIGRGDIAAVFPESCREKSYLMNDTLAADLRGWLVEPDFSSTQRLPLELDAVQKNLVVTWPATGYRRVKGPAGSGKSLVLAARAAQRARDGKSVLVVTFNITLWHYLKDLVVRARPGRGGMQMIQFDHFHLFCRRAAEQADMGNDYIALFKDFSKKRKSEQDDIIMRRVPELATHALSTGRPEKFETILVDEGQDYQPEWWNILRMALAPEGEMLLVADITQDVYGTGKAWTEEAMNGMGFAGGRWAHLRTSYRLPPLVQDHTREFANRYLPSETTDLPD
uniref:UvrD-helicase domain-containing protein n=1 Tax=Brevundimonas sp. UBA7534 TaxID=1946138 RepID=UPI0032E3893D